MQFSIVSDLPFFKICLSLPCFGMQVIVPFLMIGESVFVSIASLNALKIQCNSSGQRVLKNSFGNTSGPGALFNLAFLITSSNSSIVKT